MLGKDPIFEGSWRLQVRWQHDLLILRMMSAKLLWCKVCIVLRLRLQDVLHWQEDWVGAPILPHQAEPLDNQSGVGIRRCSGVTTLFPVVQPHPLHPFVNEWASFC